VFRVRHPFPHHPITPFPYLPISLFPYLGFPLPLVPRHLPDDTLGSELAVEFWIKALTAVIDVKKRTALLTESCLMLLTDCNRLPIRMIFTLHFPFPFILIIPENSLPGQKVIPKFQFYFN
jgi:hypothetical protein